MFSTKTPKNIQNNQINKKINKKLKIQKLKEVECSSDIDEEDVQFLLDAVQEEIEQKKNLIKWRNKLAHERYSEKFQLGVKDILNLKLTDFKSFLTKNFESSGSLFTAHKIETLVTTAVLLYSTESAIGRIAAITLCINSFSGKAVSSKVIDFIYKNKEDFVDTTERLQASELRKVLDNWDRLNDSQFIDKIRNVASYCMAFSVLEHMGVDDNAAEIVYAEFKVTKKTKQITSFVHAILDAVEFTCSRMLVCVKEGSFSPLLHTSSTYTKWFDQTLKLEKWTSMLDCDPDVLEFTFQVYEKELQDCIVQGHNMVKHAKSNLDRKSMTIVVNRLELFLSDYQTKHIVGQSRIMPFGLTLFGDSSVGKSSFAGILFSYSAKVLEQKDDPEYMYTRNFRDPFWSGFKSHKWFILLDDVGSIKPSAVQGTDPSADEIISLMNTVSLLCNMADLNEKGRVCARPLVVVATTNHPWMNVHHYSYHPSALMRRFPFRVTVRVNKDYQMDGSPTMLDPNKCKVDYSTSYPDFWDITVDKILASPLPTDGSAPSCEPIVKSEMINVGMKDFLPWFREKLISHMASQKAIKEKMATMSKVKICEHFVPVGNCRICSESFQAGDEITNKTSMTYKESLLALLLYFYFWFFAGMTRQVARVNAYQRAIPALRIANASARGVSNILDLNPFNGLRSLVLQSPRLPTHVDMVRAADSFYKKALENKKYVAIASAIAVSAALIKFLRTSEALQFSFMRPTPKDEKKAAKWTAESIHLSPLTLTRQTKSMKGLPESQILDIIAKNVISITVYPRPNSALDNNMFALGGNLYLINTHILDVCNDDFEMDCNFTVSAKAGCKNARISISKKSVIRKFHDISILELNNFPPFPKLNHLLPMEGFQARMHGKYIKRSPDGVVQISDAKNIRIGKSELIGTEGFWSDCLTHGGDCGMPLIGFTSYGPVILGIHSVGITSSSKAFTSQLFQHQIKDINIIDSGVISLSSETKQIGLETTIHHKDPVYFLDESCCEVYGTLSSGRSNIKSMVTETSIAPFFKSKGWSTEHEKPTLGTWKPWYHAMKDMSAPGLKISSAEANFLAKTTLRQMFETLPASELELIQIYDMQTAVSGANGVNYVNSLAMNTSLGFPWKQPKKSMITFDKEIESFVVTSELESRVEDMIERYKLGERCNPIFCGSEKDEARKASKNREGKIRLFMGAPTDFVIVMRMFFGSLIRVVQRNPANFECAVGINAHSKEWHMLASDLLGFGDNCLFDGDYQSYDKLMESVLIYSAIVAAGDEMINILSKDEIEIFELRNIYRAIASDVAYAYIDFNGTLVSFLRNHVSGEPLTVIVNCFVGSMYVRLAYRKSQVDDEMLENFKENIILRTYGDDNIVSVNPAIIDKFNFGVMQENLAHYGVKYTRADKLPGSYICKSLSEIDFLKRSFTYSDDLGRYVGPLNIESIKKSFLIGVSSKSITQEERDLATMNSGLREFFFHGREQYDEIANFIRECCKVNNIKYNNRNFPTYDWYLNEYKTKDIVHFEFYELDEFTDGEEFQSGSIYLKSPSRDIRSLFCDLVGENCILPDSILGEICSFSTKTNLHEASFYFPLNVDGKWIIYTTINGDLRISHLSLLPRDALNSFLDQITVKLQSKIKLKVLATILRRRARWNARYKRRIFVNMKAKLKELVHNENVWHLTQAFEIPGQWVSRDEWINPFAYQENKGMFTRNNTLNSRSSITTVPADQLAGVIRHLDLNASSGNAEQYLIQPYEEYQSSEEIILSFADESKGEIGKIGSGFDSTRNTSVFKDAAISSFLERPVLISTSTWAENTQFGLNIEPFHLFFNDSRIKNKVTNYSLLRCNLRIKVLINASPFYYGLAKTIWKPLPDYCPDNFIEVVGADGWKVPFSQIPGFYIHVEKNEGGEMTLPFFYHKNWLRITSATDTRNMGVLQVRSFTPLLNANSVTGANVTVQVYAWAENVELSGPTIAEALQAGDEYQTDGPISGPTSAIASAAGELAKVPIFKPFALATQMVSSSISNVARHFGFTNIANLQSEVPQHPGAFMGMASTNLMTPFESLTVDDKNELTIDPRVAGIQPKDELMISEFAGRESWIWQTSWSSSQSVDSILFLSRVLPELIRNEFGIVYRQSTPMAHLNRMFGNWRGDIKFRFRFICSKYHRGRVRITYDPDGDLFTNSVTSSTSVTRIVDIADECDVEMVIPYMQALSFLKTASGLPSFIENMQGGGPALIRDPLYDNGQISVRVFTQQTSPVSDAPIIMQVFVSAPNIEFAAPSEVPKDYSFEQLQSGEERSIITTNVENNDDHLYHVHFGERIVSMRQLFRRKNLYCTLQLQQATDVNDTAATINKITLPRLPVPYGFAPNGGFASPGILAPGSQFPCNYVANTPLSLLMPCFVGVTGSTVYTLNVDSPFQVASVYASRAYETYTTTTTGFKPTVSSSYITSSHGAISRLSYGALPTGPSGRVLTNQYTQAGLAFKVPMYSNRRFLATNIDNIQSVTKVDGSDIDTFTTVVWTKPNGHNAVEKSTQIQFYYMAGADFNLLYFRNVPTIWVYQLPAPTG